MRRELMAVISSNHCHLFYWRRKKERKRKGGEREREKERNALRSLAGKLLVCRGSARRYAIYVNYGHSNVIPHRLFR